MKRHAAPRDLAAANAWTRAALSPSDAAELVYHTMIEGPEPEHLCPKVGRIGEQRYLCRYLAGHTGLHYWQLAGAVLERE